MLVESIGPSMSLQPAGLANGVVGKAPVTRSVKCLESLVDCFFLSCCWLRRLLGVSKRLEGSGREGDGVVEAGRMVGCCRRGLRFVDVSEAGLCEEGK